MSEDKKVHGDHGVLIWCCIDMLVLSGLLAQRTRFAPAFFNVTARLAVSNEVYYVLILIKV